MKKQHLRLIVGVLCIICSATASPIDDRWVVTLQQHKAGSKRILQTVCDEVDTMNSSCASDCIRTFRFGVAAGFALRGFDSEQKIRSFAQHCIGPDFLEDIEPDYPTTLLQDNDASSSVCTASANELQRATWNLRQLVNASTYPPKSLTADGSGVPLYIIDSGIRQSHVEFERPNANSSSSSSRAILLYDAISDSDIETVPGGDLDGHGTHVASTAAGKSAGVARNATVYAVRVLNQRGQGRISDAIEGLDVIARSQSSNSSSSTGARGVINMSLGINRQPQSRTLSRAVSSLAGEFVFIVSSGNSADVSACSITPAFINSAITVCYHCMRNSFSSMYRV